MGRCNVGSGTRRASHKNGQSKDNKESIPLTGLRVQVHNDDFIGLSLSADRRPLAGYRYSISNFQRIMKGIPNHLIKQ